VLEESKKGSLPAAAGGGGGEGEGRGREGGRGGGGGDGVGDTLSEAELKRLRKEAPSGLILTFTQLSFTQQYYIFLNCIQTFTQYRGETAAKGSALWSRTNFFATKFYSTTPIGTPYRYLYI
jgi:hypothetical protein